MPFPALLTFSGGQGPNFRIELDSVNSTSQPIIQTPINSVKFVALDDGLVETGFEFSFVPGSDQLPAATSDTPFVPPAPGDPPYFMEYINWRTGDDIRHPISKGTNPSTGEYSFDLWPILDANGNTESSFIDQIAGGPDLTWDGWVGSPFNTLSLNPNKHTVFYDYGTPQALGWKLGGICSVALTPP